MLTRAQKEEQVATLRDKFERASSVFVADYRGLTVSAVDSLRRELHTKGEGEFEYAVVKNSVLKRASTTPGTEDLHSLYSGPTAVAISYGDPVGLAKILTTYAKENEVFELKGGVLEGKAIDQGEIATLATLPGLDELRGKLVGLLQAPAGKLARLLNEPAAQMARIVDARRAALEGGEG